MSLFDEFFDPSGTGVSSNGLFGLPHGYDDSSIVVLPVPWDVTCSYGDGTAGAPEAILAASKQLDLDSVSISRFWESGCVMAPISESLKQRGIELRRSVEWIIDDLESGRSLTPVRTEHLDQVNAGCEEMIRYVRSESDRLMDDGKTVVLLGGDHSVSFGLISAVADRFDRLGVVQIDAHMDLRDAYQGLTNSHASVMRQVSQLPSVSALVQVGIRDFCPDEREYAQSQSNIYTHYDETLHEHRFNGGTWNAIVEDIIAPLPHHVAISFDIDGLDPSLCPHTGTPVPGGLKFEEAAYLTRRIVDSGRVVVSADLVEVGVGPTEWDANVGARVLYRLIGAIQQSNRTAVD